MSTWNRAAVAGALLLATLATAANADIPNPIVTGPIAVTAPPGDPSRNYPFFATNHDLAQWGYIEEEFFIEGTANRYNTPSRATGSIIDGGHPYKTRILVRRPADPAKFEGTVFLEWSNVTGAWDSDNDWHQVYGHVLRSGYAWVLVAAQRQAVHATNSGLRDWNPTRYGTLDLTNGGTILNDALSYDVFSQAGQAVRNPKGVAPLGKLVVRRVIATGHSQSGGRLITYYNSVVPLGNVIDAFIMRGAIGNTAVRDDLGIKVFALQSEADVPTGLNYRQPDSTSYRLWEVAGTSHGDHQGQVLSRAPLALRDLGIPLSADCTFEPSRSWVPFHHVFAAAMDHLVVWLKKGTPPPSGMDRWIELASTSPAVIARDGNGNALGGIRLPDMAVPIALNTGENAGPGLCRVNGRTVPFGVDTLAGLYARHSFYVNKVRDAARQGVAAGFLLQPDADATVDKAHWSIVGSGNPCNAQCRAAESLRLRTVSFLIAPPRDGQLLKLLDRATEALASGDGQTGFNATVHYRQARLLLEQYVGKLEQLAAAERVLPSIAADLRRQAIALIAAVDALTLN
jgi:Alpha/beta hydrolase domain